jgi:hypothetical protein
MPLDVSVCIRLVFTDEQVKPPENLVMPLQTGGEGEISYVRSTGQKKRQTYSHDSKPSGSRQGR